MTPDEQIYQGQAAALRAGGFAALRDLGAEYVEEPTLKPYPSPIRWLWIALVALPFSVGIASAILMGPVVWLLTHSWVAAVWAASSPLVLTLCRSKLQDVPVAFCTVVLLLLAAGHNPFICAGVLVCCLALKEASVLVIPAVCVAWLMTGGAVLPLGLAIGAGVAIWLALSAAIFGRHLPAMFRAIRTAHGTEYSEKYQKGAPHRLFVDLVLASPVAAALALVGAVHSLPLFLTACALLLTHTFAPIRNVRFVLAADILLRIVAATSLPWFALPAVLLVDAFIALRFRKVNDPVTSALTTSLGMSPQ